MPSSDRDCRRRRYQSTHGKDAKAAKAMELAGRPGAWRCGGSRRRAAQFVRTAASATPRAGGRCATIDRYVGYWRPYATSHQAFDVDNAVQEEVRLAALALLEAVQNVHAGQPVTLAQERRPPRDK
jgi:hypothetical protein